MDKSADIYSLDYLKKLSLTRLFMHKIFEFTPVVKNKFEKKKKKFLKKHIRDTHYDFNIHEEVKGYRKFVLVQNNQEGVNEISFVFTKFFTFLSSITTFHWI